MATAIDDNQTFKMITICKDAQERVKANGMPELDEDLAEMIEILEESMGGVEGYRKKLESIEEEENKKRDEELRKTDELRKEDEEKVKDEAFRRKEQRVLEKLRKEAPLEATPEQEATMKELQAEREAEYTQKTGRPWPTAPIAAPLPAHQATVKELQTEKKEREDTTPYAGPHPAGKPAVVKHK